MNFSEQNARSLLRQIIVLLTLCLACSHATPQMRPPYTDSTKDLKQLIKELHEAAKQNDRARFRSVAEPLFLADHEAWFKEVFGERYGAYASGAYKSRTAQFLSVMHESFEALELRGLTEPQVEKLNDPCSPLALTVESPALFARRKKVPLYSVRYKNKGKFTTLGFFIYADGGFRYVGNIELGPARGKPEAKIVKVEQKTQATKLVHKPQPRYPTNARQAWIQGTVRLEAIIGVDGSVQDLRLISGHCWLAEASIDAVRQWRYQPTLVDGSPVEVATTIDVIYTLSR